MPDLPTAPQAGGNATALVAPSINNLTKVGAGHRLRAFADQSWQRVMFLWGLRRLRWASYGWLCWTRLTQAWRSMSTGAVASMSLLLATASLLVTIRPIIQGPHTGTDIVLAVVLCLAAFLGGLLFTLMVALWALPKLPPADVAKVMIGGQTASDIFRVLSYEVMRLCHGFRAHRSVGRLEDISARLVRLGTPEDLIEMIKTHRAEVERHVALIARFMQGREQAISVLAAMKAEASAQLAIPARRLCDHVLRFSPQMFVNRVAKYLRNWNEVLTIGPSLGYNFDELKARIAALLKENAAFLDQLKDRFDLKPDEPLGYVQRMFREADLHGFVHAFASDISASASLSTYASALSHIAATTALTKAREDEEALLCTQRLRFIHRTQRSRPGFSLHKTCRMLLAQVRPEETAYRETLGRLFDRMSSRHPYDLLLTDCADGKSPTLDRLRQISAVVTTATELSRTQLCANFDRHLLNWRETAGEQARLLIVTHGYSKTVREVIKRTFCHRTDGPQRVVILRSDDRDSFGTRLLEYELKQANKAAESRRPPLDITVGDEAVLAGLLDKHVWTIFLLGAEAFDDTLRVIHPHGVTARLQALRRSWLNNLPLCVMVVAEGYKRHPALIEVEEFYKDHFDQVSLYPPNLVDCIVTDDALLGSLPWQRKPLHVWNGTDRRKDNRRNYARHGPDRRVG